MSLKVKICGIRDSVSLNTAVENNVNFIGFVFDNNSPRFIAPEQATELSRNIPFSIKLVGVFVDPENDWLEQVIGQIPLDYIQLQGAEDLNRVIEIKQRYNLPIIRTLSVSDKLDLEQIEQYRGVADIILLDAKPQENVVSIVSNGSGIAFDWDILDDLDVKQKWMLSGGLNIDNIEQVLKIPNIEMIDISSGLEDIPAQKSFEKINEFFAKLNP